MPGIEEKNESEDEEMEQDTPESDKSDDDDSESGSGSDEDASSELDDEEYERRRTECIDDMSDLEKQFSELKEQLYQERLQQIDAKLEEVKEGRAVEYLSPLAQLEENMSIYTEVAAILRELKIQNNKNKYEAEMQAARQNYESEKMLLYDQVKQDLEDKIRRLEEDRHNIDITSDLWNESQSMKKKKKNEFFSPERRRKPVTVSGPYIVYMLKDMEIIEDWTAIKKALKQEEKKKKDCLFRKDSNPHEARFDNGKLYYEGETYSKGDQIVIDNKSDSPVRATVTTINPLEVWVRRTAGNKSKLYISQLQKGKYTIRHIPYC
ncbi:hypothetical protein NP493_16g05040 [Ridgeia piscesae]|uniref:Breast cancer metastasis-suppressor 1-like protein n=1 Tax=Ridgeia piscesae TaxID=27915 RepID=A0AAD9PEE0_RIDPI|nr:hypothetical protein NP493_16g05040 [Ridgeia piscesae]